MGTPLSGAFVIHLERREDHRGFFARMWSREEFSQMGLVADMVQGNVSFNRKAGTVRGMHYQRPPHQEAKLVRCTRGAVYDVIVDLRPDSSTYRRWFGLDLIEDNYTMLYVPEGFAHGYQTLLDASEVTYLVSVPYTPGAEAGLRFDDPVIGIDWPSAQQTIISEKDAAWPLLPRT